jgi:sucrose-6-phosphate hydrolase SacC (GH32 family)
MERSSCYGTLLVLLLTPLATVRAQPGAAAPAGRADLARLRNPVWTSRDNLRDPSVLKTAEGYQIFYSRLSGTNWGSPENWAVACACTKDFVHYEHDRDVSPKGYASPGDVVQWHGRHLLPYQSYPAKPTRLCMSESADLNSWSAPIPFLTEAAELPWNDARRVIDPTLVVDGETLHCFFVGTTMRPAKANLLGHAITRDPKLARWEILTKDAPLLGRSERAPDGVENVMVFKTGDQWTMIYSEGLAAQHLAWATSQDLLTWKFAGPLDIPRQTWMARKFGAPFVWRDGDQWRMILMGENTAGRTAFGLLTSPDGHTWQILPE